MPRAKKSALQDSLLEVKLSTAPCVPAIRKAVTEWREKGYKGANPTTRTLLSYWFKNDHRLANGVQFAYHDSQREAIETLIYIFEVAGVRRFKDLLETYAPNDPNLKLLQHDDFARYCVKMATGSGKTKVMSLAIAWNYFNAVCENKPEYGKTFLVIAPNVIVFERLKTDFAGGRIFNVDPIIPPELKIFWDMEFYMRGDTERAHSDGALYLTNVQQFHIRDKEDTSEPDVMTALLGPKPKADKVEVERFADRIVARDMPLMVINDEAHHTHDEKLKWNEVIRGLASQVPLAAQLDVTATPRHSKGALFSWTVFDYPLKQAIIDGIVKRPVKGIAASLQEAKSDIASTRYQAYLTAGVERWREYKESLAKLKAKPVLFLMLNSTAEADEVAEYLRLKYPSDFAGERLLVIHTDNSGEVSTKDLEVARRLARQVDEADNPVNAIVSVLMLREGWDVQNVTVVVGLRPYTSKANILPEQTIGRGLRLMFRGLAATYQERVDVIGNKGFMEFVSMLEKDEDMELGTFEVGKDKLDVVTVEPDMTKTARDILMPDLSPVLARKKTLAEEIEALDVPAPDRPLPIKFTDKELEKFIYDGFDIITQEKLFSKEYEIPEPQTVEEVISYYAKRIAQNVKLPSQFAILAPKVRAFLEEKAFGSKVKLTGKDMLRAVASNVCQHVTLTCFGKALHGLIIEELQPLLQSSGRPLSTCPPYPFSKRHFTSDKTIFNIVAPDNNFEYRFAEFLAACEDVEAFAKLPKAFGFSIHYTDSAMNLRYYEPDFVARLRDGRHILLETKGREDLEVKHKDNAARTWAENATVLTTVDWSYLKVPEKGFEALQPDLFDDLWHVDI